MRGYQQFPQFCVIPHLIPVYDIFQIRFRKNVFQISEFIFIALEVKQFRQSTEIAILFPPLLWRSVESRHKLAERKGCYVYLISPAAKFGDNIFGQKFRIAARDICVGVRNVQETVEHVFKFINKLHFVEQNVVHPFIFYQGTDVPAQHIGIAVFFIDPIVQSDFNNMIVRHPVV